MVSLDDWLCQGWGNNPGNRVKEASWKARRGGVVSFWLEALCALQKQTLQRQARARAHRDIDGDALAKWVA